MVGGRTSISAQKVRKVGRGNIGAPGHLAKGQLFRVFIHRSLEQLDELCRSFRGFAGGHIDGEYGQLLTDCQRKMRFKRFFVCSQLVNGRNVARSESFKKPFGRMFGG
jgi:hypothetical protein